MNLTYNDNPIFLGAYQYTIGGWNVAKMDSQKTDEISDCSIVFITNKNKVSVGFIEPFGKLVSDPKTALFFNTYTPLVQKIIGSIVIEEVK